MAGSAPYFHDIAEDQGNAEAFWVQTSDQLQLRVAIWPCENAKGTVFILPGRTEYVEKYGQLASDLAKSGFASTAIDWRGQGLADRLSRDKMVGHIGDFEDYQLDLNAMLALAREQGLPEPYFLLAHSMGGCIGFRALETGLPFKAAAFTAPMWGILIAGYMRPIAWALSWGARNFGSGEGYTPGTSPVTYVAEAPFQDNKLTTDPELYALMQRQAEAHPELTLGGPSLRWLYESLVEVRRLQRAKAPDIPTLTFLGSRERIIDAGPVKERMRDWPSGKLELINGAEHEVLMERPEIRSRVIEMISALFLSHV